MSKCINCKKEHKDENTGCNNSGDSNSGDRNSGDWYSGYSNSGDSNSGYRNSGDWNSGDWNSGYRNNGFFNTGEPNKIMVFNQWLDMKPSEFLEKYYIYADIPLNRWIDIKDIENPTIEQKQMGGYLKTLDFKEACQIWWGENPKEHERFTSLPNFNVAVFKEITGVDIDNTEDMIELDGKKFSKSTIKEALKQYVD